MPRLTRTVFKDLAIWMVGLGLLTGAAFPFFVVPLGVPAEQAFSARFCGATLLAGLLVGGVNWWLARMIIGSRLRTLSGGMQHVAGAIRHATVTGDWSDCDEDGCRLEVDSDDELGDCAEAFNELIGALGHSHQVESTIRELLQMLSSRLEIDQLSSAGLQWICEHVNAPAAALLSTTGDEPQVAAVHGPCDVASLPSASELRRALGSAGAAEAGVAAAAGAGGAWRIVPIAFDSVPLAVLALASSGPLGPDAQRVLGLFARAFGVALNNALTHARSQELALLDPLTGCANRRSGLAQLADELAAATRDERSLGVLMMDLDHFKRVNDAHGHLVGDQVLVRAAEVIRSCLRGTDTLVRYGGEEFLAILPGADDDALAAIAERVRAGLAASRIETGEGPLEVTTSVGAARFPGERAGTPEGLLEHADRALYRAKGAGRNRVVLASSAG